MGLGVVLCIWPLAVRSLGVKSFQIESMRVWSPSLLSVYTGALLGCARGACGNERRSDTASAFLHVSITQHTRHGHSRAVARRRPARARQSHRPARGVSRGRPLVLSAVVQLAPLASPTLCRATATSPWSLAAQSWRTVAPATAALCPVSVRRISHPRSSFPKGIFQCEVSVLRSD